MNRGTRRTARRGLDGLRARALAKFGFVAPLKTSVLLTRGVGAASFTRATVATAADFEGCCRNVLSGEVRFQNARRVANILTVTNSDTPSGSGWTITAGSGGGATGVSITAEDAFGGNKAVVLRKTGATGFGGVFAMATSVVGKTYIGSIYIRRRTGTGTIYLRTVNNTDVDITSQVTTSWRRLATAPAAATGTNVYLVVTMTAENDEIDLCFGQMEDVTAQSNRAPGEYVSVGAPKLNLVTNSEGSTTGYAGTGATLSLSAGADEGGRSAQLLTATAGAGFHYRTTATGGTMKAGTSYRLKLRVKRVNNDWMFVGLTDATLNYFNLSTGLFGTLAASTTSATAVAKADGWWELEIVGTPGAVATTCAAGLASADNTGNFVAAGTEQVLLNRLLLCESAVNSEYFPVGNVYPFHGACVDGVKYLDTTNPNRVSGNVVYSDVPTEPCEGYGQALLPGVAGSVFTTTTVGNVAGDFDLRVIGAVSDWTPSVQSMIVGKDDTGLSRSYWLSIETAGTLGFFYSPDGTLGAGTTVLSSVAVPFSDGALNGLRVHRAKSSGDITFWTSTDFGATWTQLGVTRSSPAGQSIFQSSSPLSIGARNGGASSPIPASTIYRVQIFDDGDLVADLNPRDGWTENMLQYSQAVGTAPWASSGPGTTVAADSAVAPDGTMTADTVTANSGGSASRYQTVTFSNDFHELIWRLQAGSGTRADIGIYDNTAPGFVAISADIISGPGSVAVASAIAQVTGLSATEWTTVRIRTSAATFARAHNIFLYPGGVASNTNSVIVWGAQLRRMFAFGAPSADQYVATTTAARRGWYSSTTGEFWDMNGMASLRKTRRPRYLPEPTRQNLVLRSSDLANAAWGRVNTPTITSAAKYCGDIALDLIGDDDAGLLEYFNQAITFTGDGTKSVSAYIAQGTSTSSVIRIRDDTAVAERLNATIAWSNGVPVLTVTTGQERPPEPMGGGVWRIFLLATGVIAANTNTLQILPATTAALAAANTGTIYVGGVQAENATTASSHIPTTVGVLTRNFDSLKFPTAGNYSTAEGAAYAEALVGVGVAIMTGDVGGTPSTIISRNPTLVTVFDGTNACSKAGLAPEYFSAPKKMASTWGGSRIAVTEGGLAPATSAFDGVMDAAAGFIFVGVQANGGNASMAETGPVCVAQRTITDSELVAISR